MNTPCNPLRAAGPGTLRPCRFAIWVALLAALPGLSRGAELQTLRGQVPPGVRAAQPVARLAGTKALELAIGLPLRRQAELRQLLRDIHDPNSPGYRQHLGPEEFAKRFGPSEEDYQRLMAFATASGLRVTGTHPNRTILDVEGSAADIERALHVNLRIYQHPRENRLFFAPDKEPSLSTAVPVLGISGLDDFVVPRPMNLKRGVLGGAPATRTYATGSGPRGTFLGEDYRRAYAPGVALDGKGEAVGIFALEGYYPSDIVTYTMLAGLPMVPLTNVLLNGVTGIPRPNSDNNIEVALDIEMAISMAPGLDRVIVYVGRYPNDVLNRMATDNLARQLSCSWGFGNQVDPVRQQIFMQYAAQGQSFFQASGDLGAWPGDIFPPSDDPWVTVVGGTVLTTSEPGGAWLSETTWPESGGGISTSYPIPGWQQAIRMSANLGSTSMRNIPDVACLAEVGIWVVANNGEQAAIGGTSAAAPLWAGFAAMVNQQGASLGQAPIGFVNPPLYAIGQSTTYASAFHDITTGNNTNGSSPTKFFAVPGYDLCTGWGTPNGSNLVAALLAPPIPLQILPGAPANFAGTVGGPFAPDVFAYTLTNQGAAAIEWAVSNTAPWLEVSPLAGGLTSGGAAEVVSLRLTSAADLLPAGSYGTTLWFANLSGSNTSSRQVTLDIVTQPLIAGQPVSESVWEGMSATFSLILSNPASVSYQWRFNNGAYPTNLVDGNGISGSQSASLTIQAVSPADAGSYWVIASNLAGAVTSSPAILTIAPSRPVITEAPAAQDALEGETVAFAVTAVGTQPLFYQWQKDGADLADAQDRTLVVRSVSPRDAGAYSVVVTNSMGEATSATAALTVAAAVAPGTVLSTLYSFTGDTDGSGPNALTQDAGGVFYGTTRNGGANSLGTVFRLADDGRLTGLHSFSGPPDGATPFGRLFQAGDGWLYGTAFQGGAVDNGTIFRITTNGVFTNLFSFAITNGDLPYAGLTAGQNGYLYGAAYQGGAYGRGTAFKVTTNGALSTLYSFYALSNGIDGGHPVGELTSSPDGMLYGTTYKGGTNGRGTVFRVTTNGDFASLCSFDKTNGAFPYAGVTAGEDGNLYGTTSQGGETNFGTIFRITPSGQLTTLSSFWGTNGAYPWAGLLRASDGNFYGTTAFGGRYGQGTLFRMTPSGQMATLVEFNGYNGANPQATLVEGADGTLCGTTQSGGEHGSGTVFRLMADSRPTVTEQPRSQFVFQDSAVSFSVAAYGRPQLGYQWRRDGTNLVDDATISGAVSRVLSIRQVALLDQGVYEVVIANTLGSITSAPAMLQVTSSAPFIVQQPTNQTVVPGATVLFAVSARGNEPLAHQWRLNGTNLADGTNVAGARGPTLTLKRATEANNGIYTVTISNALDSILSSPAVLTVVPVSGPGTRFTTLHWFTGGADGAIPNGLTVAAGNRLYGTTRSGGAHRYYGTVFALTPGGGLDTLVSFNRTNGSNPKAGLLQASDGLFYGTTENGGVDDLGTAFRMTGGGDLITLCSFLADSYVWNPYTALAEGPDGKFYGGALDPLALHHPVFLLTSAGTVSNFYPFIGGADGYGLAGGLTRGADAAFYGLASGGASNAGTVFRLTADGAFKLLHTFTNGSGGVEPVGSLVQATDGNFYGATKYGYLMGYRLYGTVFRISRTGEFKQLYLLNYTDGAYPFAGLVQASDGNLYGTTRDAGLHGMGTLYRITPEGAFATLLSFDGFDTGAHPETALVEGPDGSLFGTTSTAGPGGRGTLYRLGFTSSPQITMQPAGQTVGVGSDASFSVASFGAPPLHYRWLRNGTPLSDEGNLSGSGERILRLSAVTPGEQGTYSVVVSNALGSAASAGALLTVLPPPVFQSVSQSNSVLTLTWSAIAGRRYQLQANPDLSSVLWTNQGSRILASSNSISSAEPIPASGRKYYRVLLVP